LFQRRSKCLVFKPHKATRGVVNCYSAGVVTRESRIGPSFYFVFDLVLYFGFYFDFGFHFDLVFILIWLLF
jgi:hypothetical protein